MDVHLNKFTRGASGMTGVELNNGRVYVSNGHPHTCLGTAAGFGLQLTLLARHHSSFLVQISAFSAEA